MIPPLVFKFAFFAWVAYYLFVYATYCDGRIAGAKTHIGSAGWVLLTMGSGFLFILAAALAVGALFYVI